MAEMKGLTLQELQDLYDTSNDEVRKWMRDNAHLLWEKEKPE